jgi:hypothetical protein
MHEKDKDTCAADNTNDELIVGCQDRQVRYKNTAYGDSPEAI